MVQEELDRQDIEEEEAEMAFGAEVGGEDDDDEDGFVDAPQFDLRDSYAAFEHTQEQVAAAGEVSKD